MCSEVHYVDEDKRKSGDAIRVWGQGGREDGLSRRVLEILLARASQAEGNRESALDRERSRNVILLVPLGTGGPEDHVTQPQLPRPGAG